MERSKLIETLKLHKEWINTNQQNGLRANLSRADLSYEELPDIDLSYADLSYANLSGADLSGASLPQIDLSGADLSGAYLLGANLSYADLSYANLSCAILSGANLCNTDLSRVDLSGACLTGAILKEEDKPRLGVILDKKIIGYKKCKNNIIIKLEIPEGAIVFGINNKKFRTNIAKCIEISNNKSIAYSSFDDSFSYEVGKTYKIKDFNMQYNIECGTGIHFFKTLKEAEDYSW